MGQVEQKFNELISKLTGKIAFSFKTWTPLNGNQFVSKIEMNLQSETPKLIRMLGDEPLMTTDYVIITALPDGHKERDFGLLYERYSDANGYSFDHSKLIDRSLLSIDQILNIVDDGRITPSTCKGVHEEKN